MSETCQTQCLEKFGAVPTKCAKFIWKSLKFLFTLVCFVMTRIYNAMIYIFRHRFFKKMCSVTFNVIIVPLKAIASVLPKTLGNRISLLIGFIMLLIYLNLPLNKSEKFGPIFFVYSLYFLIAIVLSGYVDKSEIKKNEDGGKLAWTLKF